MTLRLSIENLDRLPDGGPLRVEVRSRGLDIGRDAHLDWTLPDPSRFVSSKHCEVRYRDGGYWLHDVSTNGTFVNESQFRLSEPYLLKDGDRLAIGQYIIAVEVQGGSAAAYAAARPEAAARPGDPWGGVGETAAPEDRRAFRQQPNAPRAPDFLDFAASVRPEDPMAGAFAPPRAAAEAWMTPAAPSAFAPIAEPIAAPTPRRPVERAPAPPTDWSAPAPDWLAPVVPPAAEPAPVASPPVTPPPVGDAPPPAAPPPVAPSPFAAPPVAPVTPVAEAAIPLPPASPAPTPPPAGGSADAAELLRRLAAAAGIPQRALAGRDPNLVIEEIGAALRISVENLAQMLSVRAESKSLMRSSSRTMIRARENNPLKFSATTEDALAIMFGAPSASYLDARQTLAQSFSDIKNHQVLSGLATQAAIEELFEEFAPTSLEKSVEPERGIGAFVGSRKAKLWDLFVERWRLRTKRSDGRLNEAFANMFAEAYDRLLNRQ